MFSSVIILLLSMITTSEAHSPVFRGYDYAAWDAGSYSTAQSNASIAAAAQTGATHLPIVVMWYQPNVTSTDIAPTRGSPTDVDIATAFARVRSLGLGTVLKPHVDLSAPVGLNWRGDIGGNWAANDPAWDAWFQSYQEFFLHVIGVAVQGGDLDLLIVGTELTATERQSAHWRSLIATIRAKFGERIHQITYGVNWFPGPANVNWWDALDIIGVDAYYILTSGEKDPSVESMQKGWATPLKLIESVATQYNKSVVFCELGYQSIQGCTSGEKSGPVDDSCQQRAYEAYFTTVWTQEWSMGVFWWLWQPQSPYQQWSPQGKSGLGTIKQYFSQN